MRRTLFPAALSLLLACALASCDKNELNENPALYQVRISAVSAQVPTKTQIAPESTRTDMTSVWWSPGDTVGVFGATSLNSAFTSDIAEIAPNALFSGLMTSGDTPLCAYYPYRKDCSDKSAIPVSISRIQDYTGPGSISAGDFKVSVIPARQSSGDYTFTFSPKTVLLRLDLDLTALKGVSSDEVVKSVHFSATGDSASSQSWTGEFSFDLEALASGQSSELQPVAAARTYPGVVVRFPDTPSVSRPVEAYANIAPAVRKDDIVQIRVVTDKHSISFNVTALKDFESGCCYDVSLDLSLATASENALSIVETSDITPEMTAFGFTAAANEGKILAHKASYTGSTDPVVSSVSGVDLTVSQSDGVIEGVIPYLYDYSLAPYFTVPSGCSVTVGGEEQTSGVSVQDFTAPVVYTVSAVNSDGEIESREYTVKLSGSGIPVVVINIPQSGLTLSKNSSFLDYTNIPSKDSDFAKDHSISIYENGVLSLDSAACGIRLRGNSSQLLAKRPMAIKLVDKAGVLGMKKHKRWCLIASIYDRTMIRNAFSYRLANAVQTHFENGTVGEPLGRGFIYNPHGRNVEVVLNGLHIGCYYLCEQIKIDKNRLNIKDCYEDVVEDGNSSPSISDCGFLIELSGEFDEDCKFRTAKRQLPVMFKDSLSSGMLKEMEAWFNDIEANLYNGSTAVTGGNTSDARKYYDAAYEKIDINSMIDWWIVMELAMNDEMQHPKSCYMYRDGDSKLFAGPVWDFDWQTYVNISKFNSDSRFSAMETAAGEPYPYKFTYNGGYSALFYQRADWGTGTLAKPNGYVWYPLLFKDSVFVERVKARWNSLYDSVLKTQGAVITELGTSLEQAAESNWSIWNISVSHGGNSGDEFLTYSAAIESMRTTYESRVEGLNTAINALPDTQ